MNKKIAEIVVASILQEMEKGVAPWHRPWIVLPRQNLTTRKPYRGINRFTLALCASGEEFFITFNQARQLDGHVRAGAKALPIVFWAKAETKKNTADGANEAGLVDDGRAKSDHYSFMKYYNVFKLSDINGIERPQIGTPKRTNDNIESFIKATGVNIHSGSRQAAYCPTLDIVEMPEMARFDSEAHYYTTFFHELVHWTGAESRLNRHKKAEIFGSELYSKEELVAEIGAAMLCHVYGINMIPHNAAYVENWLKALKDDKNMIITAASRAEKVLDFLGVFAAEKGEPANEAKAVCAA
jgi:antirestriction protein ArdC